MSKIFVTGASGALGTALVPKLAAAGYAITGLGRSEASVKRIKSLANGVKAIKGDITDLEVCTKTANEADIVIHLAFDHGQAFSGDFPGACKKDKAVMEALCNGLAQTGDASGKTLMYASGTLGLVGRTEKDEPHRNPGLPRYEGGDLASSYISKGLQIVCLRLAPITYSAEKIHDFIGMQIGAAKNAGYVAYTDNHAWPTCSYDACADCILLALKNVKEFPNPVNLHLIAEEGVAHEEVAKVLASKMGISSKRIEESELAPLGLIGALMGMANSASSDYTKKLTGWNPKDAGLISQIKAYSLD